jgi:hypothetical protein
MEFPRHLVRTPDGDEQMETKLQNPGIGSERVGVAVSP